jgi:protein TonB
VDWPPPVELPELTAPVESEAVPAPPPPPGPRPQPQKVEKADKTPEEQVAPATAAPASIPAPRAPVNAAPINSPSPSMIAARQSYNGLLHAQLKRNFRYPRISQQRREEGQVLMRMVLDRDGNLLEVTLLRGSGHERLNREALATARRASPLPVPPPEIMTGDTLRREVPFGFSLR